jgi:hypothetical protein
MSVCKAGYSATALVSRSLQYNILVTSLSLAAYGKYFCKAQYTENSHFLTTFTTTLVYQPPPFPTLYSRRKYNPTVEKTSLNTPMKWTKFSEPQNVPRQQAVLSVGSGRYFVSQWIFVFYLSASFVTSLRERTYATFTHTFKSVVLNFPQAYRFCAAWIFHWWHTTIPCSL